MKKLPPTPVLDEHSARFIFSTSGFYERYVSNLAYFNTNKAAYEQTERQYTFIASRRKFKSYDVFKAAYCQYCRRRAVKHPL